MTVEATDKFHNAPFALQQLGVRKGVDLWTNAVMVAEAMNRGLDLQAGERQQLIISQGQRQFSWMDGASNLNSVLARRCARQKEVTSRLLRGRGVSAPENAVFAPGDLDRAYAWAAPVFPVVIKPVDANQGRGVHMDIHDRETFREAFLNVAENYGEVLVEVFAAGVEHRVLVVSGNVVAATRRVPANVVGDGRHTIAELVAIKNRDRGRVHKPLRIDEVVSKRLKMQGLDEHHVPSVDQQVVLRATSNLHTGGDAVDATEDLKPDEVELVERASHAIPGLRLAGFDVLLPRGGVESAATILEVNPSPMISMHHFPQIGTPRDVAGKILDSMFPPRR